MEFENVKDAIKFMLELSEKGATMKTNGVDSTIDDYKRNVQRNFVFNV